MQRFEVMIKVKSTLVTKDNSEALEHFLETFTMEDEDNEAVFYDLDIYSNDENGNFVVKVLVDSELELDDLACSVFFEFDSELVTNKEFSQIRTAY